MMRGRGEERRAKNGRRSWKIARHAAFGVLFSYVQAPTWLAFERDVPDPDVKDLFEGFLLAPWSWLTAARFPLHPLFRCVVL